MACLEPKVPLLFSLLFAQPEKSRKLLPTSYIRGPNFNGSSVFAAFFFQDIDHFYSITATRPTYNESHKVGTRRTMSTRMLANKTT
jgi:hypothetical protein